jgi:hypothetical protein
MEETVPAVSCWANLRVGLGLSLTPHIAQIFTPDNYQSNTLRRLRFLITSIPAVENGMSSTT